MKAKICGVTRPEDAQLACRLGAWAIGLVFAAGSPRRLTIGEARLVRRVVPPGVLVVGVFQDNPAEEIVKTVEACSLGAAQIRGAAPAGLSVPVFHVLGPEEGPPAGSQAVLIEPLRTQESRATAQAPAEERQRAAWEACARLEGSVPLVIVAGGLDPDNVAEAIRVSRCGAVDLASGVEAGIGRKDPEKLERFFAAIKGF